MKNDIFNHKPKKNEYSDNDRIKFKKPVYVKDDLETLNRLFTHYSKVKHNQNKSSRFSGFGGGGTAFRFPEQNQRVTFKMSYSNSLASHNKYVDYYMPQKNKDYVEEKPQLFGMSDEEYEKNIVPLNFKCIISPESQDIDLETLVESYIKRVENQTGYKLCWKGCIHNDTEHRHAHVVINGRDLNGEDVFFNKDTIKLMRLMCSNAATQMIGERTKEQIELAKKNALKAKRWTELDERIQNSLDSNGSLSRNNLSLESESRLSFLSELKLSILDNETNRWFVSDKFKDVLTAAGRYNTYLEEYIKDAKNPVELYTGGSVKGFVEKVITFDENEAWNDAIIINTGKKRVYVPVWQLQKENLQGKNVMIRKSKNDSTIARQVSDKNIIVRD